jgi:hypothetical protein
MTTGADTAITMAVNADREERAVALRAEMHQMMPDHESLRTRCRASSTKLLRRRQPVDTRGSCGYLPREERAVAHTFENGGKGV